MLPLFVTARRTLNEKCAVPERQKLWDAVRFTERCENNHGYCHLFHPNDSHTCNLIEEVGAQHPLRAETGESSVHAHVEHSSWRHSTS